MAYSARTGVLSKLALENDDKIIRALLLNPRLREEEVVAIVRRESTSGFVLRVVALSERCANDMIERCWDAGQDIAGQCEKRSTRTRMRLSM